MRVLIADDDDDDREFLVQVINDLAPEIEVLQASNGRIALEIASNCPVNVIFLDLYMPVMTAIDLLPELRGKAVKVDCPVVVMSTLKNPDLVDKCLQLGADKFLIKPPLSIHWLQK
jgi:PleD family two-component response regulator